MKRRKWSRGLWLLALTLLVGSAWMQTDADAQRGLRAQVYLTQARLPRSLSERGLIQAARRGNRGRRGPILRETTDQPIPERRWSANMVVAFNRSPQEMQFEALFYDVHDGVDRFIAPALTVFVSDRDQKTFVQRIRLERPQFKPNRRMQLRVVIRRREVGRANFQIQGEEVRRSGEVSFGDSET